MPLKSCIHINVKFVFYLCVCVCAHMCEVACGGSPGTGVGSCELPFTGTENPTSASRASALSWGAISPDPAFIKYSLNYENNAKPSYTVHSFLFSSMLHLRDRFPA